METVSRLSFKLVEPIQSRKLIGFSESWIVEHRVAKIFNRSAIEQHGLAVVKFHSGNPDPLCDRLKSNLRCLHRILHGTR